MTPLRRIAFVGNSLPRRCGIATFTTDLQQAVAALDPELKAVTMALTDCGRAYDYPASVVFQIREDHVEDYEEAADVLNAGRFDVVCLQHEFGIFGGDAGAHILLTLSRLTMPVVTTFHTVLATPTPAQRKVMDRVIDASAKVIVMTRMGRELMRSIYQVSDAKIEVIAHGIPDVAFASPDAAKARRGFSGRSVILTFGLLSPNKGIEVVIDAMPAILEQCPEAVYVVLGATHPNLVRDQGEAYRESLLARVRELDIQDHVVFSDAFVDLATLIQYISMCDVYVTPYLDEAQMTSGTLAYSFGLGKAVVSTPYWHANELLADGRGVLVPFGDVSAIGHAVGELLTDDARRLAIGKRAYDLSRSMTWKRTAEAYAATFDRARQGHGGRTIPRLTKNAGARTPVPAMRTGHFLSMCDDTGLFQHAVHSVPDRSHGYCVDDNARALLLALALDNPGEQPLPEVMTARFAAFIQHAWNPNVGRFRNFMGFDRRWLEDRGSEDSHGRTLWALGAAACHDTSPSRRRWASALFARALTTVETFASPRAWAFTLLGLDGYCCAVPGDHYAAETRIALADQLMSGLAFAELPDWVWFEEGLAYDNARLPQALLVTGAATKTPAYVDAGLKTLSWLSPRQTAPNGSFRPVGTAGYGELRKAPRPFDQQPVEAAATIAACLAAWRADGDARWKTLAQAAFDWFFGANDLSEALVDSETGGCRDGLHPDRANENQGGESVVCYLLGLAEIRELARSSGGLTKAAALHSIVN